MYLYFKFKKINCHSKKNMRLKDILSLVPLCHTLSCWHGTRHMLQFKDPVQYMIDPHYVHRGNIYVLLIRFCSSMGIVMFNLVLHHCSNDIQ